MNDDLFIAELYTNGLLPDDLKSEINTLPTSAKRAIKFLDQVIKPAIDNNGSRIFYTLLTVMEHSDNHVVIKLAEHILSMLTGFPL